MRPASLRIQVWMDIDVYKRQAKNPAAFLLTGTEDQFMEPRCLQNRLKEYTKNCNLEGVHFHTLVKIPATAASAGASDCHSAVDSGSSSPNTTYKNVYESFSLPQMQYLHESSEMAG